MQKKGGVNITNAPECTNAERSETPAAPHRSTTSARDHTHSTPIFISFSQIFPNITGQHQQQRAKHHQNQSVTQQKNPSAQHSTAEQRAEENRMYPNQPNGRVARARGGKCARIGLERAFVCRVGNYSRTMLNRGSRPRGTLRNVHSHKAWEQMRQFPPDCGRIVPWFVPGDMA